MAKELDFQNGEPTDDSTDRVECPQCGDLVPRRVLEDDKHDCPEEA